MTSALRLLVFLLIACFAASARSADNRESQHSSHPGHESLSSGTGDAFTTVTGTVYSIISDVAGNIYIGGLFSSVAGVPANNVAKWNGIYWSALGSGTDWEVRALAIYKGELYVGGLFSAAGGAPANNIARWNGYTWFALGAGTDGNDDIPGGWSTVYSLVVHDGKLIVGGNFNTADGRPANHIASWDGTAWGTLEVGLSYLLVRSMVVRQGELYVGGADYAPVGSFPYVLYKWNGSGWLALDHEVWSSVSGRIPALACDGIDLYASMWSNNIIRTPPVYSYYETEGIKKHDGTRWRPVGDECPDTMVARNGVLYTGSPSGVRAYQDTSYVTLGSISNVTSVAFIGDDLCAGGKFASGGGLVSGVAKWDGSAWVEFPRISGPAVTPVRSDCFTTRGTWVPSGNGKLGASGMEYDYDPAGQALRMRVYSANVWPGGTPKRARQGGWYAIDPADWLPYSAVGSEYYVRGKFYVYATGQASPAQRNQIPVFSCTVSNRFAATANLEVSSHNNALPGIQSNLLELAPTTSALTPSIYRVDYDPPDVPYLAAHPEEGIWRSFCAFCTDPQDNGYICLAESSMGVYPAAALADTPESLRKTYSAAAGDLERYPGMSSRYNVRFAPGSTEGAFPTEVDTTSSKRIAITVTPTGATYDSSAVPTDWIGTGSHYFDPTRAGALPRTQIPRVAPGKQYKMRFHLSGTQQSNRQTPFWLYAHTLGFGWGNRLELGGAYVVGGNDPSNQIAWQVMPGVGSQVTDGWYTVLVNTPLDPDIRAEFTGGEPVEQRMPLASAQPGAGAEADSLRDLESAVTMIDTLNFGTPEAVLESGNITLDAIEVREYERVPD